LIPRAERELASGTGSARKTLERARREFLKERDAEGLKRVLEVASRLDDGGDLPYAIRQNLKFLGRQAQHEPNSPQGAMGSIVTLLVVLFGAFIGVLFAVALAALTFLGDNDALVWVAALFGFSFIFMPTGAVVAFSLLRRSRRRRAQLADPS
jgi:hypothetical protein